MRFTVLWWRKKLASKKVTKEILAQALHKTGFSYRLAKSRTKSAPIVLYYHRVHEHQDSLNYIPTLSIHIRQFAAQIRYLREHFDIVSLYDIYRYCQHGVILNRNAVAITFDDGFRDNYHLAFPVLKKYGIPATVFVTTGLIGKHDLMW